MPLELAAWSDDGGSALLREAGDRWLVVNAAGVRTFVVAGPNCKAASKGLARATHSMSGVTVRSEACTVTVGALQAERVARSYVSDAEVRRTGRKLRIERGDQLEIVRVDHRARSISWATVGPLLIVVEPPGTLLAAVVTTPRGMVTVLPEPEPDHLKVARR